MARSRNIKPGFFQNDQLAELGPYAQLLFAGLWTIADREGRLEDRPKRIKINTLPYYDVNVDDILNQLTNSGFILRYKFDEKKYIQIINFDQHQNPHVKECASTIQAPDLSDIKTPDSLSLDSLNLDPQTDTVQEPLSGKPDVPPEILKNKKCKEAAITVLEFLNEKTGKNYQPVLANLNLIISRLKEGSTEKDCFAIIENKIKEWSTDSKMMNYTRPKTLFNKINFWNYHGELVKQSKPREKKYCSCGRETLGQKYNQCAECLSLNSFDGLQAR